MSMTLGIVGGGGWLGHAIARSVLDDGLVAPEAMTLSYRSKQPAGVPGVYLTRDNAELTARSDVIILCVRPEDWPAIEIDAGGKLIVSVMAGITLDTLAERHNTDRVIRTLPNAATELRASYTPLVAAVGVNDLDRALVRRLFESCGLVDEVATELQLDYLTGLTGTGPAYPSLMAAAMVDDAIAYGFDRTIATRAINQLFVGTGLLIEASCADPEETVKTFMAYRGVTAAGLTAMREAGLEAAVRSGLDAALQRSIQMGRGS